MVLEPDIKLNAAEPKRLRLLSAKVTLRPLGGTWLTSRPPMFTTGSPWRLFSATAQPPNNITLFIVRLEDELLTVLNPNHLDLLAPRSVRKQPLGSWSRDGITPIDSFFCTCCILNWTSYSYVLNWTVLLVSNRPNGQLTVRESKLIAGAGSSSTGQAQLANQHSKLIQKNLFIRILNIRISSKYSYHLR